MVEPGGHRDQRSRQRRLSSTREIAKNAAKTILLQDAMPPQGQRETQELPAPRRRQRPTTLGAAAPQLVRASCHSLRWSWQPTKCGQPSHRDPSHRILPFFNSSRQSGINPPLHPHPHPTPHELLGIVPVQSGQGGRGDGPHGGSALKPQDPASIAASICYIVFICEY